MTKHDKFNHRGTFKCVSCDRRTRDTGQGVDHLCYECYELAGLDNQVNDDGRGPDTLTESERSERDQLLAKIIKLGGNAEKVKKQDNYLF